MYIQANIGRNVTDLRDGSDMTLNDQSWAMFQRDVKDEIFLAVHDTDIAIAVEIEFEDFQVHIGVGEWQGVKEESAHVSVYFDSDGRAWDEPTSTWRDLAPAIRDALQKRLSYLAFQYGQDAIAFVVTDSHLATR